MIATASPRIVSGTYRIIDSPLRPFALMQAADGSLRATWLSERDEASLIGWRRDDRMLSDLAKRLAAYFRGKEVDFSDIPTPRGPAFFQRCWAACRRIPRGATRSYAQLAKAAGGGANASRAAGQSMRRNPLPIIVPCHRVIGANGLLHGFAGCVDDDAVELRIKRSLLMMEGAAVALLPH